MQTEYIIEEPKETLARIYSDANREYQPESGKKPSARYRKAVDFLKAETRDLRELGEEGLVDIVRSAEEVIGGVSRVYTLSDKQKKIAILAALTYAALC